MPSGVPDWEVPGCANPLLLQFVGEMLAEAKERNTKSITTYNRAYNSLKAQTISYTHPCELKQLVGYGDGICNRLTDRLKSYCEENGRPMPQKPRRKKKPSAAAEDNDDNDAPSPAKKPKKVKPYAPKPRTGPYALLLALGSLDEDAPEGLTKGETIELAQEHCDSSFLAPSDPGGFYTAWRSMNTLVDKDLVQEKGRPSKRYRLTDDGWDCYRRLKSAIDVTENGPIDKYVGNNSKNNDKGGDDDDDSQTLFTKSYTSIAEKGKDAKTSDKTGKRDNDETDKVNDIVPEGQKITDESSLPTFSPITIQPWQFSVEFVLDNREIKSMKDRDYMQNEFIKKGIRPIMRSMELGDALWIAKCKDPQLLPRLGLEGDEIMLDYIVERKRLDDLVSSIKDNRFHEQKFRLKRSGVKNIIYLVEEMKLTDESITRTGEMMQSAMASTQVVDGFFLKKTQKMDDTIRYLDRMTKLLKNMYENKTLSIIPTKHLTAKNHIALIQSLAKKQPGQDFHITYEAFGSLASKSKSMTLRDYYLKMLMCTRGITGEKAVGIQKIWKTPIEFVEAFEACGSDGDLSKKRKREMVSSKMGGFNGRKKVAASLSAKVAENWAGVPPAK